MAQLVPDWLRQRAASTPERLALIAGEARCSYAELDQRVDAAAAYLERRGLRPGDSVGLLAPNGPGFVIAVHALMRLGAILVPLNLRLAPAELDWQRQDAALSAVLTEDDLAELASAPPAAPRERTFDLDEPHSVIYTSGTTGRPKGAILTYGNYWWSAAASALNLGLLPHDRWLAVLPLFHVGGLSILLRSVLYGITAEVHARFDAAQVNAAIDAGTSIVSVVSTMLDRMLQERAGRPYPASLRCLLLGGGPAPMPLLEQARQLGAPVVQTYGLTETASQVATLAPEDALRKLGSAGKPLMGLQLRISEDSEIWVQGPTVSPGYLHQPPRAEPWLRTGDLGSLDAEGFLYVLDRRDDLIVSGGENVYPAEVESVLRGHPAVDDACVVGVPDAEWGQRVAALVACRPAQSVTPAELDAFCRARLAGYKVPRQFAFAAALPRNASGKLLRRQVRAAFAP